MKLGIIEGFFSCLSPSSEELTSSKYGAEINLSFMTLLELKSHRHSAVCFTAVQQFVSLDT